MIGWRSSRIGAGDHLVEATSSAASWIGGWEGEGDVVCSPPTIMTETGGEYVSSVIKAGCGMMEERTSGPLLPVIKAGCCGRLAIKKTATTLGDAYGAQLSAHLQC